MSIRRDPLLLLQKRSAFLSWSPGYPGRSIYNNSYSIRSIALDKNQVGFLKSEKTNLLLTKLIGCREAPTKINCVCGGAFNRFFPQEKLALKKILQHIRNVTWLQQT